VTAQTTAPAPETAAASRLWQTGRQGLGFRVLGQQSLAGLRAWPLCYQSAGSRVAGAGGCAHGTPSKPPTPALPEWVRQQGAARAPASCHVQLMVRLAVSVHCLQQNFLYKLPHVHADVRNASTNTAFLSQALTRVGASAGCCTRPSILSCAAVPRSSSSSDSCAPQQKGQRQRQRQQ
jgi:hypothetical protein